MKPARDFGGIYDLARYQFARAEPSYWEQVTPALSFSPARLSADARHDVAIIGGGYAGLSAAYFLARHGVDCVVLETGSLAWGASGRNGGFVCLGASFLSTVELVARFGEGEARRFIEAQRAGIALVADIASNEHFDISRQGEGMLQIAHRPGRMRDIEQEADALQRLCGIASTPISVERLRSLGLSTHEAHGGALKHAGFGINPLAYARGLAGAALRAGAALHAHSRVIALGRDGDRHLLSTETGTVRARHVVFACNGYMPEHLHPALAGRVLPVQSNIIVTAPMARCDDALEGVPISNTRELLWYFRRLGDGRILFGGRGDTSGTARAASRMRRQLERGVADMYPDQATPRTDYFWGGFISITRNFTPAIGALGDDPTIHYAFGCHGNGIALMTFAGKAIADAIAKVSHAPLPAPLARWPRAFPASGRIRRTALRLALGLALVRAAMRDRLT